MGWAKRSCGVTLAAIRRKLTHQLKGNGEGVVATQVSPNSAYREAICVPLESAESGDEMRETEFSETLPSNPFHDQINGFLLPLWRKLNAHRNLPPSVHASTTASCGGMLRLEHRMPMHWGLLAIIRRHSRRKFPPDKVLGVPANRVQPLLGDVPSIRFRQLESTAKLGFRQFLKCGIERHFFSGAIAGVLPARNSYIWRPICLRPSLISG